MKIYVFVIGIILVISAATITIYFKSNNHIEPTTASYIHESTEQPETTKSMKHIDNDSNQSNKPNGLTDNKPDKEKPDWLKEPTTNESSKQFKDPWKDFEFTDELVDNTIDTTNLDISDPASYDLLKIEMINRYGDTPKVENYMQSWIKTVSNPNNIQYKADFAKAAYDIFPHPATQKSMQILNAIANNDLGTLHKYAEPSQNNDQFSDVQSFFEGNTSHIEGFRRLRHYNPIRSAQFERFILDKARKDPHIDFEKIRGDIEASYKNDSQ